MDSTLPIYQNTARKRSWIVDSLIMLLFATTIAFLLVLLGKSSGGDAVASQKISEQLQTVDTSKTLPAELPKTTIRGAVKAQNTLLDPFAPADPYAEDSKSAAPEKALALPAKQQALIRPDDNSISLSDQQEILKILTGESTDETTR